MARLQPYGIAHQRIASHNAGLGGELFIVIGSAQKGGDKWNPFTFKERYTMVDRSIKEAGIAATIVGLRDFGNNKRWVDEMVRLVGYDKTEVVVSSRNPYTQNACRENEVAVEEHPLFFMNGEFPEGLSASIIRQRIACGQPWEHLVPNAVARYLNEIIDGKETGVARVCRTEAMESTQKEPCCPEPESA